jgi:DNA-binding transcriptional LysR family regulator
MVRLLQDSHMVKTELERGLIDIAFLQSEDVEGSDLRHTDVLFERYIGIARKGSIEKRPMPIERFIQSKHIIVSPRAEGFRGSTDEALAAMGLTRQVAFAVSSFMFLIEAVAQCDLLAVAPERLASRYSERIDMFAPPVAVPGFSIAMVWHDRTHNHPARIWLREQLEAFCAKH